MIEAANAAPPGPTRAEDANGRAAHDRADAGDRSAGANPSDPFGAGLGHGKDELVVLAACHRERLSPFGGEPAQASSVWYSTRVDERADAAGLANVTEILEKP